MKLYENSTIIITGGATGIGFGFAQKFGKNGATIIIGEPRQDKLGQAISVLRAEGIDAHSHPLDVTQLDSVEAFADFAFSQKHPVKIVINNAGVSMRPTPMTRQPIEQVRALFDVNFFGVWHGCSIFGKKLIAQNTPAAIYNIGSENSFFTAAPNIAAYVASKHAVRGLTEAMQEEMPDHISVGLICPGFVQSELTPPPFGDLAMNTEQFIDMAYEQIEAGEFYIVSHAYNIERIRPIHDNIESAYQTYAPRYDGDIKYDVRYLINQAQRD